MISSVLLPTVTTLVLESAALHFLPSFEGCYCHVCPFPLQVNRFRQSQSEGQTDPMSVEEVAMGFVRVANEAMCRPIRSLTQVRKMDTVTVPGLIDNASTWRR